MVQTFSGAIKSHAQALMENNQMCDLRFGEVISVSPLKVKITTQFILTESLLIVPEHLTDHKVYVTIDWETENHTHGHTISDTYTGGGSATNNTHKHGVTGKKAMIMHEALKVGDKVALIRKTGGQVYYILDRI